MTALNVPSAVEKNHALASAESRSQFFWLLAESLLHGLRTEAWLPIQEGAEENWDEPGDPLFSAWRILVRALKDQAPGAASRLAIEHTRLFGGLKEGDGPPPPYESVWFPDSAPGLVASLVVQEYAAAGFADIDLEAGPQDHLGVELKFMALLAMKEAQALTQGDSVEAARRIAQQRQFLDRHLLSWVPRWEDALVQATAEPVYWALAGLISAGLAQLPEALPEALPD